MISAAIAVFFTGLFMALLMDNATSFQKTIGIVLAIVGLVITLFLVVLARRKKAYSSVRTLGADDDIRVLNMGDCIGGW